MSFILRVMKDRFILPKFVLLMPRKPLSAYKPWLSAFCVRWRWCRRYLFISLMVCGRCSILLRCGMVACCPLIRFGTHTCAIRRCCRNSNRSLAIYLKCSRYIIKVRLYQASIYFQKRLSGGTIFFCYLVTAVHVHIISLSNFHNLYVPCSLTWVLFIFFLIFSSIISCSL